MNIGTASLFTSLNATSVTTPVTAQSGSVAEESKEHQAQTTASFQGHATEAFNRLHQQLSTQNEHAEKVARIKQEIADGSFYIDSGKIAEELLRGEQMLAYTE
ncbi:MAG: flagellar biosynthesis anti-sigma factor FlgM [Gammaproteobacteria bacterium]|jgi:flagellar biosynthesis anti-sigma factor FlgM|nr:flagellar biosynthesis anti-sigma factor FlgM [Gammaproteobacteria bacterium]MBT3489709.1 flagellar biosynthesis anti-sigma factor FlgM [Gammaproteobacteria bacterium]MBT3719670.1 flagellar biosynthesis anti-sigma factor FlgM [Gammaproteobacteria bacterium]MBT3845444.1 flagellar biosynthesis anti-sigma factor FlgM [Gammaproteobacteria bacterium]MBT3892847.1 flagellar biosynthesis anti-sigma factor FlgM [Gammaproteobacteria bacterium]